MTSETVAAPFRVRKRIVTLTVRFDSPSLSTVEGSKTKNNCVTLSEDNDNCVTLSESEGSQILRCPDGPVRALRTTQELLDKERSVNHPTGGPQGMVELPA